jgi:glucose/arabinose dehydrogenase
VASFAGATYVTAPPKAKGRLFVTTRDGRIWQIRHGKVVKRPFLDIRKRVMFSDQRGLLSMAFAPDYARSHRFYVFYVTRKDTVQIDEWRGKHRRKVLNAGAGGEFHHGGQLQFGPDGDLWISTGIGDDPSRSQDPADLHGKLLRIDPTAEGAKPEIWASGLRNPWRFSFDRKTGDLVIGDVGEKTAEEVDYLPADTPAGSNFGFDLFEGNEGSGPAPASYVPPLVEHLHKDGFCAVMGGYVVRDKSLRGLYGRYLYGDLCKKRQFSLDLHTGKERPVKTGLPEVVSFGEDARAHLYAVGLNGTIYRLARK